jgi:hypothetical protein
MPKGKGYRSDRLRRRRRSTVERSQAWLLYVLAGAVAFAAVLGAWYVASRWADKEPAAQKQGYLAVLELTVPGSEAPVAGLLVVQDGAGEDPGVYLIPPDLLLEGPNGEYVFAADAMTSGTLKQDLQRVIGAPVDAVYQVPVAALGRWAGTSGFPVKLERPVSVDLETGTRVIKDGESVASGDLPAIFAAEGTSRRDLTALQTTLVQAALDAAALRSTAERSSLVPAASASPDTDPSLREIVARITSGSAQVGRFPSGTRVAEGQFAFVPDAQGVMARITRRAPSYKADVTVQVRNGSGKVGVGGAVVERLSSLDVNLPTPTNADSFSYRQTQILAGADTLAVARDIRAILGRGVVLDGADLPSATIVVIVGDDIRATRPNSKD